MMRGLKSPAQPAGLGVESDHSARDRFVEGAPLPSIGIRGRISHREINQAERLVCADGRPAVGRGRRVDLPGGRRTDPIRLAGIKGPGELAGHRIIGPDDTRRTAPVLTIRDASADDHLSADHLRGRTDIEQPMRIGRDPFSRSTEPSLPKPAQNAPVFVSKATRVGFWLGAKIRSAQGPLAFGTL